ncbi:MAG: hypothetical protein NTZ16_16185 [Verrucomicrobia bacterium]|nr:hypothetical protein [Verrucomicrobiota bacterium]
MNKQPAKVVDSLTSKTTFLNLLVAQLKNQDPLNPQDGSQFVAQLAQFSQLEQTMTMSSDLAAIRGVLAPATTAAATTDESGGQTGQA